MSRTNIVLDDALVEEGLRLTGLPSKRALVQEALTAYVAWQRRRRISELRGKVEFDAEYDHRRLRNSRQSS